MDYVSRTVSGPPVASQSQIPHLGLKLWPPLT